MEKEGIMETYLLKYQKLIKGIGILELIGGVMSLSVVFSTITKLNSGGYILLVPAWQFFSLSIILVALQFSLGVFGLCFSKSEKVKYCMYLGIVSICFLALNAVLNHTFEFNFSSLARFILPALYTSFSLNLHQYYKRTSK